MPPAEPLWYCHECHAEMRPLMTPNPVCASCHGDFVEKMENPQDDPREFDHDHGFADDLPAPGIDTFLLTLQALMEGGMANNGRPTPRGPRADGSAAAPRLSFQFTSNNGTRTMSFGGPNTLGGPPSATHSEGEDRVPTATEFLGGPPGANGSRITGPMMAQYLLALLGNRDPLSQMLAAGMGGAGLPGGPESGRMGDYVFNQEALDQIITQIMENSNAHRPNPATDEIMAKLPREVLTIGSATLERDCAVCKDTFKIETDDPDELIVVTLPCKHPFHEPCIIPWLKSSGTCPVCRFALVPQPSAHGEASTSNTSSPSRSSQPPASPSLQSSPPSRSTSARPDSTPSHGHGSGGGLLSSLFSAFTGHHDQSSSHHSSSATSSPPPFGSSSATERPWQQPRSNSDPTRRNSTGGSGRRNDPHNSHPPGGWADDLD